MNDSTVLKENDKPLVVNSPLSVFGYWLAMFTLLVLPLTIAICLCSGLSALPDGGWEWLWYSGIAGFALILVTLLWAANFEEAKADLLGLTLGKAWQSSTRKHIGWADIHSLEIEFDTRPFRRSGRPFRASLTIQDGKIQRVISCPPDVSLFREIVSRAELNLSDGPENWQAKADDPFEALRRTRFDKQRWIWTRS